MEVIKVSDKSKRSLLKEDKEELSFAGDRAVSGCVHRDGDLR